MKTSLLLCMSACLAVTACATMRSRIASQEDLLSAAGFDVKPANTPQRQDEVKRLPADKFVMHSKDDRVVYLYADPVVCDCLYVGDQKAYDAYKREEFQRNIADEQQLTAQMYQGTWDWDGWDWGPWGWGGRWW